MDNLGKYVYAEQKRQEGTGYMKQQTVYLKCDRSAEVQAQDVFLKDVAEIRCQDPVLQAKLKAIKIYHFPKDGEKRCVISCLKLVSLMEEICPEIDVQVVGETDVLVEWICVNRHKGWQQWIKAAFVSVHTDPFHQHICLSNHLHIDLRTDFFHKTYQFQTTDHTSFFAVLGKMINFDGF
jgi:hypothetical protein